MSSTPPLTLQVYAGLGGPAYPVWPQTSPAGYADDAVHNLIAYAKTNLLDGYDLNFQNSLNKDWVTQWTTVVSKLAVGLDTIPAKIVIRQWSVFCQGSTQCNSTTRHCCQLLHTHAQTKSDHDIACQVRSYAHALKAEQNSAVHAAVD